MVWGDGSVANPNLHSKEPQSRTTAGGGDIFFGESCIKKK